MTIAKRVAVTGAQGFIGRALVRFLCVASQEEVQPELLLIDQVMPPAGGFAESPGIHYCQGDFHDRASLQTLRDFQPDVVYHLASVPGALAEKEQALGKAVNLDGTLALIDSVAGRMRRTGEPVRFVFASSVAVYGALDMASPCSEDQNPSPQLTYGTHKLITELYLADLSRRGLVDAISLRLPGIVARPPTKTGHGSAFMSDLFHYLANQEYYECPVSPNAVCWWLSRQECVENLVHGAKLDTSVAPAHRTVQLPAITAKVEGMIKAISNVREVGDSMVAFRPNESIEALFGRCPDLLTPEAIQLGFRHDGDLISLVKMVFEGLRSIHDSSRGL